MYEDILVCLDGSSRAEEVVPYMVEDAFKFNSRVKLLQVIPAPVVLSPGIPGGGGVYMEKPRMLEEIQIDQDEAFGYLNSVLPRFEDKGIDAEPVVVSGMAGEVIVDYAEENDIGLIAMATHGRTGLNRAFVGSVADYVLRESRRPVFLLRTREYKRR